MEIVPQFIAGEWRTDGRPAPLLNPYTGAHFADIMAATDVQVDTAVESLVSAFRQHRPLPLHERYVILSRAAVLVTERSAALIASIVAESGFTVQDATTEVLRATQTLQLCAEEARRLTGDMVPMEGAPGVSGRIGFTMRHPLGVVCAITPFNSPLNTVVHKVGPALAAGNAVLLKPALATPMTSVLLFEILLEAGVPPHLLALVQGDGPDVGQRLLENPAIRFYAFTGSTAVGEHIASTIGLRRRQLELGSIASTIICEDADLDVALPLVVAAAYRKAGQVCTSIQRLYVHEDVLEDATDRLIARIGGLSVGDPADAHTFVGTLIDDAAATRVDSWVQAAVDAGAERLLGGERERALLQPVLLRDVDSTMDVLRREVFGPVMSIVPFSDLDKALSQANDSPFGLAAGIFTNDLPRAMRAASELEMGSVHINQTSSSRIDLMPYSGAKSSGYGQEGPRYAIREMTEERLITITT